MANYGKQTTNIPALKKELAQNGPDRLYLLWGEEDYLREDFFTSVCKLCLDGDADGFNHTRFDGPGLDLDALTGAVNTLPFMAERTLVEVRGFDLCKCRGDAAETLAALVTDLPDCCTLAFIQGTAWSPDGRLSLIKTLKKHGRVIEFTAQAEDQLIRWIKRRVQADGKAIGDSKARHLIFNAGSHMNTLISEISKLVSYAEGSEIRARDIDAVVTRVPEAEVFEMTDKLAAGDANGAAVAMSRLLASQEHPIMLLGAIGSQMRKLYGARLAIDNGQGAGYLMEAFGIRYAFVADKLMGAARKLSLQRLSRAVTLCAETDYAMKSSGMDDKELLTDLLLKLSMGDANG